MCEEARASDGHSRAALDPPATGHDARRRGRLDVIGEPERIRLDEVVSVQRESERGRYRTAESRLWGGGGVTAIQNSYQRNKTTEV